MLHHLDLLQLSVARTKTTQDKGKSDEEGSMMNDDICFPSLSHSILFYFRDLLRSDCQTGLKPAWKCLDDGGEAARVLEEDEADDG